MQVQLQTTDATTIADDAPIIFNTVLNSLSPNISYNATTGEITVTASGIYYINWWLGIDGSTVAPTITYAIVTSAGDTILSSSPILSDNMSGNALLDITASVGTPVIIQLVNQTGNDTFLGSPLTKADLTILQITSA